MDSEDATPRNPTSNGSIVSPPRLPSLITNTSSRDILLRSSDPMLTLMSEQCDTLKKIEGHMQQDESEEQTNNEWYLLAKVLDRLCLFIYIFMTFLTSVIFLAKMAGSWNFIFFFILFYKRNKVIFFIVLDASSTFLLDSYGFLSFFVVNCLSCFISSVNHFTYLWTITF